MRLFFPSTMVVDNTQNSSVVLTEKLEEKSIDPGGFSMSIVCREEVFHSEGVQKLYFRVFVKTARPRQDVKRPIGP